MKLLALGIAAAFAAFGLTFRGPRARFWDRMTATGLVLGGLAGKRRRAAEEVRPTAHGPDGAPHADRQGGRHTDGSTTKEVTSARLI